MSAAELNALIQISHLAIDTVVRVQNGELSEDEIAERWTKIHSQLAQANASWEAAAPKK